MPKVKKEYIIETFKHGTINTIDPKLIKKGAASHSRNFITSLDRIELSRGRQLIGEEVAGNDPVLGLHTAYRQDGTAVVFRKNGTKLEYYDGEAWQEAKTGLTDGEELCFANVVTPAGHMVYMASLDGLFKVYSANPASVIDLSDSTKNANIRSKILFNKSRLIGWGAKNDPTGLYFSKVDRDSNYTSITGESVGASGSTEYSGTLANGQVFGLVIKDGTQTVTDDKNGNLIGDGTGTINYATGAYSVTFNATTATAVTADYLYENPKTGGLADFTWSATRLAGEGNIQRQDSQGSITRAVNVFDDKYFSLQDRGSWEVNINAADDNWSNQVHRREAGTPSWKASVPTANGIVYVDNFEPENIKLKMLTYDVNNELIVPITFSEDKNGIGFDMGRFVWDRDTVLFKFGDLIVMSCKTSDSTVNNRTILYNTTLRCFDVLDNGYNFFTIVDNKLWGGDSSSSNVYEIFTGWDDLDYGIEGEWESGDDRLDTEQLKKVKRFQAEGYIARSQKFEVWLSFDNDEYEYVETVDGDGPYVNESEQIEVGSHMLGDQMIGGDNTTTIANLFLREMRVKAPKFQKVQIKLVPIGLGYLDIRKLKFSDIRHKGHKIPSKYRRSHGSGVGYDRVGVSIEIK